MNRIRLQLQFLEVDTNRTCPARGRQLSTSGIAGEIERLLVEQFHGRFTCHCRKVLGQPIFLGLNDITENQNNKRQHAGGRP